MCDDGGMTDETNAATDALKRALAAKKASAGAASSGGFKPARHEEKAVARQNAAANKPAFRKASKRG